MTNTSLGATVFQDLGLSKDGDFFLFNMKSGVFW